VPVIQGGITMSVYKRGAKGVFYMNFTVNGVRIFKSTGKYTKKEAKQAEANEKQKMLNEVTMTPQERNANMLLEDAIKQVFEGKWKNNKDVIGPKTRCKRLLELLGNIPLLKIDEDIVAELVRKLDATNIKPASVNRFLATLKTILNFKRQRCDHIKLRKESKGRIRVISKEEEITAVNLLRNTQHSERRKFYYDVADLVEVLIDTGMRLSEALTLSYEDVNFDSNLIHIWINKGERPRSVPMTKKVASVSFFRTIHPPEPLIFQGHSPTPFSRAFTHLG
jgi:integrase